MNRNDTGTNRTSLKRPGSKSLFWSAAALAAVLVCAAPFFRNVHAQNGADPAAELRTDAPKQRRECLEAPGQVNGRSEREHERDAEKTRCGKGRIRRSGDTGNPGIRGR